MTDSSRDPVSGAYAPVGFIEAEWRRGGVHWIIQADAASRLGLIQALDVTNMHELSIEPATLEDKILLFRLLQLYFFDSTHWSDEDLQEDGLYECEEEGLLNYFDSSEGNRAYILRVSGKPAGFTLVEDVPFEGKRISEFSDLFVLPKYRRLGLASAATTHIVINSENPWLFAIFRKDHEARRYWQASFKRLPFRSVRAADDPAEDRFHFFVVNEQVAQRDA